MLLFGDQKALDSLPHTNMGASRIRWHSVPLPVGEGRKMGKVGVSRGCARNHSKSALRVQNRALFFPEAYQRQEDDESLRVHRTELYHLILRTSTPMLPRRVTTFTALPQASFYGAFVTKPGNATPRFPLGGTFQLHLFDWKFVPNRYKSDRKFKKVYISRS